MQSTLEKMIENLPALTVDDLVVLSKEVNSAWKHRQTMKTKKLKSNLHPGDSVTFTGRKRAGRGVKSETFIVEGHVTKVKRKRALVTCLGGLSWDVNLMSLTKIV
jgi:hypothetical protein